MAILTKKMPVVWGLCPQDPNCVRRRQILPLSLSLSLIKIQLRVFYPPNQKNYPAFYPSTLSKIPLGYFYPKITQRLWALPSDPRQCETQTNFIFGFKSTP